MWRFLYVFIYMYICLTFFIAFTFFCLNYFSDRLIEGLDCLKLAEAMRTHHDVLRPIFVAGHSQLTIPSLLDVFKVFLSPPGSKARRSENRTLTFWRDWLIDVGGKLFCSLQLLVSSSFICQFSGVFFHTLFLTPFLYFS